MNNSANVQISAELLKDLQERGLTKDTAVRELLNKLGVSVTDYNMGLADKIPDFTQQSVEEESQQELPPEITAVIQAVKERFGDDAEVHVAELTSEGIKELLGGLKPSQESKDCSNPDCMNCKLNEIISLSEQITTATYLPIAKVFAVDVLAESLVELTHFANLLLLREEETVIFERMKKFEAIYAMAEKIASVDYPEFEEKQDNLLKTLDLVKLKLISYISNI